MAIKNDSSSFVALAFRNGLEYRNSDIKRFNLDDLATSCKKLVEIRSSTSEFRRGKDVNPLIDQQFGYFHLAAPLLDLAGISTEFCGVMSTQF